MERFAIPFLCALALVGCTDERSGSAPTATVSAAQNPAPEAPATDPRAVHRATLTLDTHVDIPLDFATDAADPLDMNAQVNLLKMNEGGLDAAFFIVYVEQGPRTPEGYAKAEADALTKFAGIHRMTDELYPDRIGLAYRADDVTRIAAEGKLVAAIGIENGFVMGKDLALLDRYYELGARYMTLAHNGHNDLADSAQPRPALGDAPAEHDGVSALGADVIRRMNELGIMVDISHGSKQTALDAIELSRAPVIASHSAARAVADHVRNLDDETLLKLRDNGGVVQIVAYDPYIKAQPPEQRAAMQALQQRLGLTPPIDPAELDESLRNEFLRGVAEINAQWPPADLDDFVAHVDHVVDLIGIDYVGISSDFGGGGGINGWTDALETPNVSYALLEAGYSRDDLAKLWSGNLLRVWREVERVAADLAR